MIHTNYKKKTKKRMKKGLPALIKATSEYKKVLQKRLLQEENSVQVSLSPDPRS
jgi:hypothetical protein